MVAWSATDTNGDATILAQRYTSNGAAVGTNVTVPVFAAGNQTNPQVVGLSDGKIVVVYEDTSHGYGSIGISAIVARVFNNDGTPLQDLQIHGPGLGTATASPTSSDSTVSALQAELAQLQSDTESLQAEAVAASKALAEAQAAKEARDAAAAAQSVRHVVRHAEPTHSAAPKPTKTKVSAPKPAPSSHTETGASGSGEGDDDDHEGGDDD